MKTLEVKCSNCDGRGYDFLERKCNQCNGVGFVPTPEGENILHLIRHHLKALMTWSEND